MTRPTLAGIFDAVAAASPDVSAKALRSRSRARHIARARQVAHYLSRLLTDFSYAQIGIYFGHSENTVSYNYHVVARRRQTDHAFNLFVAALAESLQAGAAALPVATTSRERLRQAENTIRNLERRIEALEAMLAVRNAA